MTFRQIELFVLVCQHESIARVSELNYVSPQSISRMMKDLELELDTCLLTRTSSGIYPTEIGVYFRDECIEILAKKDAMVKNISQLSSNSKTTINVGMVMGSIAALNYHIFDEFQENHPNLVIQYAEFHDAELEERFLDGEFDFCIHTKSLDPAQFHSDKLLSEKVYLSIPKEHDLYHKEMITMNDLRNQEFAMFTDAYYIKKKFMACFEETGFSPTIKIASSDFNSIKNLAYQNNLLSLDVQHSLKKEHSFRHVLFPCSNLLHEFWIIKKKTDTSPVTEQLCQHIREHVSY